MNITAHLKSYLYKEPERVRYIWLFLGLGVVLGALGIAGTIVPDSRSELFTLGWESLLIGFAVSCGSVAELVPSDRLRTAALLRASYLGGVGLYGVSIVYRVLMGSPREQYFFGGLFAIVGVTIIAVWVAMKIWGGTQQTGTEG